jgi:tRNA 2-thiocytidine biosynthesis protein TtcA
VVIRPLAYVRECDLDAYAREREFPIIPCDLCGSQANLQRQQVKVMLREWEKRFPGRVETIFNALSNVTPSHLLDPGLFDFRGVHSTNLASADGDVGFDGASLLDEAQRTR